MTARAHFVAAGFALTALTYGLARFAYGLLLPDIQSELALSARSAGTVGGLAFAAYCLGVLSAFGLRKRMADRSLAVGAALIACAGLLFMALSSGVVTLGLATALCGLSTGLTSPALASLVSRIVAPAGRSRANGAINAGTAAGIMVSAVSASLLSDGWRMLYAFYAALGAAITIWLCFVIPKAPTKRAEAPPPLDRRALPDIHPLCIAAAMMGCGSTAIWTFGASALREMAGFSDLRIAFAWGALGVAGLFGAATGVLTDRFGIVRMHRMALVVMACAIAALTLVAAVPGLDIAIMAAFGFAYILSSGSLLLWGIALLPDRPDLGLGVAFLAIALGQTAGAPVFGILSDAFGMATAILGFAGVMALATAWRPRVSAAQEAPPTRPS